MGFPAGGGSSAGGLVSVFSSTLSSPAASIDTGAGGVPAGHGTLIIVICGATSGSGTDVGVNITVNNDSSALYDRQQIAAANVTASASIAQAATSWALDLIGTNASDSYTSVLQIMVPLYDKTTFWKSAVCSIGMPYSQSTANHFFGYGLGYRSTNAISRVAITAATANLVTGTSLQIFGTQ